MKTFIYLFSESVTILYSAEFWDVDKLKSAATFGK